MLGGGKLTAALPIEIPAVVIFRIAAEDGAAYLVRLRVVGLALVDDRGVVQLGQQVVPVGVIVGVGLLGCFGQRSGGVDCPLFHLEDIPGGIIVIVVGYRNIGRSRSVTVVVDLACKLILRVVLVGNKQIVRAGALANLRDIAKRIIDVLFALKDRIVALKTDIAELDLLGGAGTVDVSVSIGRAEQ